MQVSGFVLAGGASKRMGRDKALLPFHGTTLVEHVAQTVRQAAGSVALIGDPDRLSHLGLPVFADQLPSCGPASGIYTALRVTDANWNLVVACDMPAVPVEILNELMCRAETEDAGCVAAAGPSGAPEPLCAVYHRRCLPVFERAIRDGRVKMRDVVSEIGVKVMPVPAAALVNVNTPAEWSEFADRHA